MKLLLILILIISCSDELPKKIPKEIGVQKVPLPLCSNPAHARNDYQCASKCSRELGGVRVGPAGADGCGPCYCYEG